MDATVAALIAAYRASAAFGAHAPNTQRNWCRHLARIEVLIGSKPAGALRKRDIRTLRDAFAATPAEANNTLRALSATLSWGARRGWLQENPCLKFRGLMYRPAPYRAWSADAIALLEREARTDLWAIAAIALYTGQRLGDCLALTWRDAADDLIALRQQKTHRPLVIPMHRRLQALWQTLPRRHETVLTNRCGRPWTVNGFQVSWRKELQREALQPIRAAGLVFHGLRKSAVAMLLEAGCSDPEVMAITGQSPAMMDHYARDIDRSRLIATAVATWHASQGTVRP